MTEAEFTALHADVLGSVALANRLVLLWHECRKLREELDRQKAFNLELANRVAGQSDLLSRRAEAATTAV